MSGSTLKKGKASGPIVHPDYLRVGVPANTNIAPEEIRRCLSDNAARAASGGGKVRRQGAFWRGFSDGQIRSAQKLYAGFLRLYGGAGFRTQDYRFLPKVRSVAVDQISVLEESFSRWAREAQGEGISVASVLDIIVFGLSCREVDGKLRKRKGFARKNLEFGLDFYERLQMSYTNLEKNT